MRPILLTIILFLFNSVAICQSGQDFDNVKKFLDFYFDGKYEDVRYNENTLEMSFISNKEGYKQYYTNVYIVKNQQNFLNSVDLSQSLFKSYVNNSYVKFNEKGFMIEYRTNIGSSADNIKSILKFSGNNYSELQTFKPDDYKGNLKLEKPILDASIIDSNPYGCCALYGKHFVMYDYINESYLIKDKDDEVVFMTKLKDRQRMGTFDFTLNGITEKGTFWENKPLSNNPGNPNSGWLILNQYSDIDGDYERYGENGEIILQGTFREGRRIGKWKELIDEDEFPVEVIYDIWYDNEEKLNLDFLEGKFYRIGNYNNGNFEGQISLEYPTGEKLGTYNIKLNEYNNEVYSGNFLFYYKNGKPFAKGFFDSDGYVKDLEVYTENEKKVRFNKKDYLD